MQDQGPPPGPEPDLSHHCWPGLRDQPTAQGFPSTNIPPHQANSRPFQEPGERIHWRSGRPRSDQRSKRSRWGRGVSQNTLFGRPRLQADPGQAGILRRARSTSLRARARGPGKSWICSGDHLLSPHRDTAQPSFRLYSLQQINAATRPGSWRRTRSGGHPDQGQPAISSRRGRFGGEKQAASELRASSLSWGPAVAAAGQRSKQGRQQRGSTRFELVISMLAVTDCHRAEATGAIDTAALPNSSAPLLRSRAPIELHHQLAAGGGSQRIRAAHPFSSRAHPASAPVPASGSPAPAEPDPSA